MEAAWHLAAPLFGEHIPERVAHGDDAHESMVSIDHGEGDQAVARDNAGNLIGVRQQLNGDRLVFHQLTNSGVRCGKHQVAQRYLTQEASLAVDHIHGEGHLGIGLVTANGGERFSDSCLWA